MATTINSTTRLQSYQTLIYSRSLQSDFTHAPEVRAVIQNYYTLNIALMPGSHACTFNSVDGSATELVTDFALGNSEIALIDSILCSAEKDIEHPIPRTKINYITSAQTEQLSTHLYNETYEELDQHARDSGALTHRYKDCTGQCLSLIVTQKHAQEIHLQAYHLIASENLVLRTQSIFELLPPTHQK